MSEQSLLENEVAAMTAIYADDFETKTYSYKPAWKALETVTTCRLRVRPASDHLKGSVSVFITFTIPHAYPSDPIVVLVEPDQNLLSTNIKALSKLLDLEAQQLSGQESMYAIALAASEYITDNNTLTANKSAFEERQHRQRILTDCESSAILSDASDVGDDHDIVQKIQRDLSVKQDLLQDHVKSLSNSIIWELKTKQSIDKCRVVKSIGKRFSPSYVLTNESEDVFLHSQFIFTNPRYTKSKATIASIRACFEKLMTYSHPNLCTVHQAKLSNQDGVLILDVLEESSLVSIHQVLNAAFQFSQRAAMRYISQIRDALAYLKDRSCFHGCLNLHALCLTDDSSVKVNGSYLHLLEQMDKNDRFVLGEDLSTSRIPLPWICPDAIASCSSDVYDLGRLALQFLFGSTVLSRSLETVDIASIDCIALDIMLISDTAQRATLDSLVIGDQSSLQTIPIDNQMDAALQKTSRYALDFEEVEWLGRGAFGSVVRCINAVDGRSYAVKCVHLKGNATQQDKIIREVQTLSRLHHSNVVRYFTAWIETTFEHTLEGMESASDFSDSVDDNNLTIDVEKKSLFIQMEYCESRTLRHTFLSVRFISRHLIDKTGALEVELGWRIYKDILEGLSYIHAQNMSHRDIKLNNIFLLLDNTAKIGDFGLATVRSQGSRPLVRSMKKADGSDEFSETLTSEIGTATYSAPEIVSRRYTSKVDVFSLGICFFEMIYTFSTGMQRSIVLRDLRVGVMPEDVDPKYSDQCAIIRKLVSFDPNNRPSAESALQDPRIPSLPSASVDLLDDIKVTLNAGKASGLIKPFFDQQVERYREFTFDYNSIFEKHDPMLAICIDSLKRKLGTYFRIIGAIQIDVPIYQPKTLTTTQLLGSTHYVEYVDKGGSVSILVPSPFQSIAFIRIMTKSQLSNSVKRFSIELAYSVNDAGGEYCVQYDHITPSNHWLDFIEAISTCLDVCSILDPQDKIILINSMELVECLVNVIGKELDPSQRKTIVRLLSMSSPRKWNQKEISDAHGINADTLDRIAALDVDYSMATVDDMMLLFVNTPHEKQALASIARVKDMMRHLQSIETTSRVKVMFNQLFVPLSHSLYKNTLVFQIVTRTKKKSDTVGFGGDYQSVIRAYQPPTRKGDTFGYGWTIPLSRFLSKTQHQSFLSSWITKDAASNILPFIERRLDVLLIQFGQSTDYETVNVLNLIRTAGISAEYLLCKLYQTTSSELAKLATQHGTTLYIILKAKAGQLSIKLKNIVTHVEDQVIKEELIARLRSELTSTTLAAQIADTKPKLDISGLENIKITILQSTSLKNTSLKSKKRQALQSRALAALRESIEEFKVGQMFLVDLPVALVDQFVASSMQFDGMSVDSKQRDYLELIKVHIQKVQGHAWIYSSIDSVVVHCSR